MFIENIMYNRNINNSKNYGPLTSLNSPYRLNLRFNSQTKNNFFYIKKTLVNLNWFKNNCRLITPK